MTPRWTTRSSASERDGEPAPEPQAETEQKQAIRCEGAPLAGGAPLHRIEATFVLPQSWGIGLRFADPTNTYNVPCDIRDGRAVQAVVAGVEPGSQAALHHPQIVPGLVLRISFRPRPVPPKQLVWSFRSSTAS